ncbi:MULTISPECIES: SDR family oxidoreductase [unclassified Bosea (in: a-proteobacteria)]|nr:MULTISPECIES: SDR family oxidoreductase [unclassified Bosea (in: a-proteobacteria)]
MPTEMGSGRILITGASAGIGAVYADRLAKRGHALMLVARNGEKLRDLAQGLIRETGVSVEVLAADLGNRAELAGVEERLRDDAQITGLINNAGMAGEGPFASADPDHLERVIQLNVMTVTRLAAAAAPRMARQRRGLIVNIASVTALMPAAFTAVYPATKAFVLAFSEALHAELSPKGVRVQAVLPGITQTAIWDEQRLAQIPSEMVMEVGDMVDAALAGLDLGEAVTIPSLPDLKDWTAFLAGREALGPQLSLRKPAARYITQGKFEIQGRSS